MARRVDATLLRKAVRAGSPKVAHRLLDKLGPAELAQALAELPPAELRVVVDHLLAVGRLAPTLFAIPDELLPEVIQNFDVKLVAHVLDRLKADDATRLAHRLGEDLRYRALAQLGAERRETITRLLRFSPESAGGRMIPRFVAVAPAATVGEAIRRIREAGEDVPLFYLYVVEENGRLVGVTSLSQLVKHADDTPLQTLMTTDVVAVGPGADQEEVARIVSRRNLLALPVVEDEKLIGLVTIDDVIDVLEQEATEDMYNMAGLSEGDRVFSPPHRSLFKRLPWNALNLLTALGAAMVVGLFEGTIGKLVALATFMPVVAGIGGNTGNQTLTVIIRGIVLGELEFASAFRAIVKEMIVGLSIGVIVGTAVGLIAFVWKGSLMLGVVILLAMVANLFVAALVGTAIPLTLRRLGMDPALGGSILLTMCTDMFGFLAFLGLATLFLRYLV
ncbi:MAG: magnesium transporter [Deltaproteobacteria bacterium]|nr:magnesium transporter [Deltaproteobacteria bacterium]